MKKLCTKVLSLILVLVMSLSMIAVTAAADFDNGESSSSNPDTVVIGDDDIKNVIGDADGDDADQKDEKDAPQPEQGNTSANDTDDETDEADTADNTDDVTAGEPTEDEPEADKDKEFLKFTDAAGHWAEARLKAAYCDGLLTGYNDGLMHPNDKITKAQILAILCRVLDASEKADISSFGIAEGRWYYNYVSMAEYLGMVPNSSGDFNAPLTRAEAFVILARAYQLFMAAPDTEAFYGYSDSKFLSGEQRLAAASLVNQGYIEGYGGALHISDNITRAEFVTILYRVANSFTDDAEALKGSEDNIVFSGNAAFSNLTLNNLWLSCTNESVSLSNSDIATLVIRSNNLNSLSIKDNVHISRLVLANANGDIELYPQRRSSIDCAVVGFGAGKVELGGNIENAEVTGSGRNVTVNTYLKKLVVSGNNNTIELSRRNSIDELIITGTGNSIIVNGTVITLNIAGRNTSAEGPGTVKYAVVSTRYYTLNVNAVSKLEIIDTGISETVLNLRPSADPLPAGETLKVSADFDNPAEDKNCLAEWYVDGKKVSTSNFIMGDSNPEMSYKYEYSYSMKLTSEIKCVITNVTDDGEEQKIEKCITIKLNNYPKSHYLDYVSKIVKTGYGGNYTYDWAYNNDYESDIKELWVNAKGYKSDTKYLVWVSLKYQRVNIFEKVNGEWDLKKTFMCGSGAPGSATPVGEYTVWMKQRAWIDDSYYVAPVVRFYTNTGYAFHSQLYYPNNHDRLLDLRIGFPISHGCIRMYRGEVQWMYDNIPLGTKVVVY